MTVRIRKVEEGDVEELHRIINVAYRMDLGWTSEASLVQDERITVAQLVQLIKEDRDPILVAEILSTDDASGQEDVHKLVGCIQAELWFNHPQYNLPENSTLFGLFAVDPSCQSMGIGKSLFHAMIDHVKRHFDQVNLGVIWVLHVREKILAWYERMGFKWEGETRPFVMPEKLKIPNLHFKVLTLKI
ncbi:hypothetical protein MP228_009733 [Amoeboaphelidium protococcarum]|nr:hypothetical protein MP228_009733 [Amoeboaphelidium protococcarum]